jgi:hypothetical protein
VQEAGEDWHPRSRLGQVWRLLLGGSYSNPLKYQKTKHMHIRHFFIRDLVKEGTVVVHRADTDDMLADIFIDERKERKWTFFVSMLMTRCTSEILSGRVRKTDTCTAGRPRGYNTILSFAGRTCRREDVRIETQKDIGEKE